MNSTKRTQIDCLEDSGDQTIARPDHPLVELLELYATNDIGPKRRKKVTQHLEGCAGCRAELSRIREARRRLRDLLAMALAVGEL